ncbi:hypothetical protein Ate02nite_60370 [Paractinoplanes tereljensis]|uniref:MlaB-like STAS domain-containing protein n=1 Tax=Paractinoplanes tereljensis TaxID=571912 RepID=A0A919NTL9_9ACTN|nr:hypothetical protein Ate02nite_60370 [Actinoplanes tereljensis]
MVLTIRRRWDPLYGLMVEADGALDADTCPVLQATLLTALTETAVCCDLGGASVFGAAAADTLAVVHLHAAYLRQPFSIREISDLAASVLRITGLDAILTIV